MIKQFELARCNILVTGATGLLGRPLVDKLVERGAYVFATSIEPEPAGFPACYTRADLLGDDWEWMLNDIDYVFHLAGGKGGVGIGRTKAFDFVRVNVQPTLRLVRALRTRSRVKRFLFVSSVGAYPGDRTEFVEDCIEAGPPHESDYFGGYAKRFGEVLCKAAREQFALDYVVVRPTNCYGPYDRFDAQTGMVIAALITRLEAGENPLKLWGDGNQRRDFLYSKDCAEGMIRAVEYGETSEAYNLGTGVPIPLYVVVSALKEMYPDMGVPIYDDTKPTGPTTRVMDMYKSMDKFGNFLQYDAISGFRRAIKETVEWYRANKNTDKYDPFK